MSAVDTEPYCVPFPETRRQAIVLLLMSPQGKQGQSRCKPCREGTHQGAEEGGMLPARGLGQAPRRS